MSVRTRFAPSPTGLLHVGGARTALFNYYFSQSQGGTFLLRMEDTDRERSKSEFEEDILKSMQWMGMSWSEEIVYQSKRAQQHKEIIAKLLETGAAYKCFCTSLELEKMREEAKKKGLKRLYDGTWRDRTDHPEGQSYVVRFKVPHEGALVVKDAILGDVSFPLEEQDDFVIARSDGSPTYQLSVVADDLFMKISHVIRGDDHLNNTPKQILIYEALGASLPVFAHLPLILGADKKKLSKRHGAVSTTHYQGQGILPQAMRSYMMKLGWGHGDQEIFTDEELKDLFSLDACRKSAAVFDVEKLKWVNNHFLQKLSGKEIVEAVATWGDISVLLSDDSKQKLLAALVERSNTLEEIWQQAQWAVCEDYPKDEKQMEKGLKNLPSEALELFVTKLKENPDAQGSPEKMHQLLSDTVSQSGLGFGKVAKPIRLLVTGNLNSPDLSLCLASLDSGLLAQRLSNH